MGVSWRPMGCLWALLGLQNSLLGRLRDALEPLQVPSRTLKAAAGPHLGTRSGSKAAGKLIFEVPMMNFLCFPTVSTYWETFMIRTSLARGGMCAAL